MLLAKCACDCLRRSRLDGVGNVITLYTCKLCLQNALAIVRDLDCKFGSGVIQLELLDNVSLDALGKVDGVDPAAFLM